MNMALLYRRGMHNADNLIQYNWPIKEQLALQDLCAQQGVQIPHRFCRGSGDRSSDVYGAPEPT